MISASHLLLSLSVLHVVLGQDTVPNNTQPLFVTSKVIAPDGFERDAIVVNGTFPGPTIVAHKHDSMLLPLHNELHDPTMRQSTSIHWHGFFQARTSSMDGPAQVNQCPISPGNTFDYQFELAEQTGNFWYHSHLSTQYCDGLRGAFVVYDPDDPLADLYDVDDATTIITLAEWYHTPAIQAQAQDFKTGVVPIPDSGLINGAGRYNGGPLVPFAVITVQQGKRYRFRVFSLSCRPFFTLSFDNHTFDVIEADGIEVSPVPVDNFDIYAAQRYSIILNANQTVGNYWIRAPPTGGAPAGNPNFNPNLTLAVLRYEGAPDEEPTTTSSISNKLREENMHPIINPGAPGGDVPADIAITLNITQPNPPFFEINGISYTPPTVPVLLQILSGAGKPSDFLPNEHVFSVARDKIVEVSIPGAGDHPFHLHGHAFDIIRTSNSTLVNFVNPPRRDVVAVTGGNMTFRFRTDNPGAWFLHCHIDWHLEAGLAVVFGEDPADNISGPQSQVNLEEWDQLCPAYNALPPEEQ